jgi:hypothetical protein
VAQWRGLETTLRCLDCKAYHLGLKICNWPSTEEVVQHAALSEPRSLSPGFALHRRHNRAHGNRPVASGVGSLKAWSIAEVLRLLATSARGYGAQPVMIGRRQLRDPSRAPHFVKDHPRGSEEYTLRRNRKPAGLRAASSLPRPHRQSVPRSCGLMWRRAVPGRL